LEETKIVFVGLSGSGKTTLLNRLVSGEFRAVPQTMGFEADTFVYANKIRVNAIDLGGQETFIHAFWRDFVPSADVIVFLIDAAAHNLMTKVRDTLLTVLSWIEDKRPIFMVLANKQDLPGAYDFGDVIAVLNLTEIAEMPVEALQIFSCSAKTGYGIGKAFDWLTSRITRTEAFPRAHIYQAFVYESPGVLVGSTIFRSFISPMEGVEQGISMVQANEFYSKLAEFVKQIGDQGFEASPQNIKPLILANPIPKCPNLRIDHFRDVKRRLDCLVVSEEPDSQSAIKAAAESALTITKAYRKIHPYEVMPEEILKQQISFFAIPSETDQTGISYSQECEDRMKGMAGKEKLEADYASSSETEEKKQDYAFFTKLSVLDRAFEK
jgi:small GTP-binding protein